MTHRNKANKFIELANKRVNRAIKDLHLIANLSNRQNYEFSEDQAKKIVKALQAEVDAVKQGFLGAVDGANREFRL